LKPLFATSVFIITFVEQFRKENKKDNEKLNYHRTTATPTSATTLVAWESYA